LIALALLLASALPEGALAGDGSENYRETVRYDLSARLDPIAKTVVGTGTVAWTNRGAKPVRELWWHLYLNAFKNDRSTFMLESKGQLRGDEFERGEWGHVEVNALAVRGHDLLAGRTFEHPDDDNEEDRTVMKTPLPFEVAPGETVELTIAFTSKLPRVFARSGWGGSFFLVAQWFPKLGVLEDEGWNCHQYHATSEFFADYGKFRVAITVPADHVVGATGVRVAEKKNGDGTITYVHEQERVHDFAFTADPRFVKLERRFDPALEVSEEERAEASALVGIGEESLALSPVDVTLLVQPEHQMYADRYFRAAFESLAWFGLWYGAYPYSVLTVVDGPRVARGAMGMEYPTFITGGVAWPSPAAGPSPEGVTVHEFGHQYWYGLVGSNEFEESWLDEGFNTYSTGKVLDRAYGPFMIAPRVLGIPLTPWFSNVRIDQLTAHRVPVHALASQDAIARRAWEFRSFRSYGINSYPRTGLMLRQLEREIGPSATARALRAYHLRWRYRHPTMADFVAAAEESADRSLDHFFEPAFYSSNECDYAVTALTSEQRKTAAGVFDDGTEIDPDRADDLDDEDESRPWDTEVFVERKGGVVHPVTLEVEFEDGSKERAEWDGQYRWQRFRFAKPVKAKHARLHPDGELVMDIDRSNDSRTVSGNYLPGASWGAHVLYLVQTIWQLLGGLL
jgi:hypothetical protein